MSIVKLVRIIDLSLVYNTSAWCLSVYSVADQSAGVSKSFSRFRILLFFLLRLEKLDSVQSNRTSSGADLSGQGDFSFLIKLPKVVLLLLRLHLYLIKTTYLY